MRRAGAIAALCVCVAASAFSPAIGADSHIRSKAYDVTSDLPKAELDPLVKRMDLVAAEYARRFASFAPRDARSSQLRVFRTKERYLAFLRSVGLDGANTAGVYFEGMAIAPTLCAWTEGNPRGRLFHVLQHEGFHQFMSSRIGGNVPVWANEGLAEYFGDAIEVKGTLRTGIAPPSAIESVQQGIKEGKTFPFGQFIRMSNEEWGRRVTEGDARAGLMYDQAWSIAHFLIQADNGKYADRFQRFLKETGAGHTVDQALETAFGSSNVEPFEAAWEKYMMALTPDPIATAVERLEFLGEGLSSLDRMDRHPTTIEELKQMLIDAKFIAVFPTHSAVRYFRADDPELYTPPPSAKGMPGSIRMEAALAASKPSRRTNPKKAAPVPSGPPMPMDIVITGQPVEIRLTWFRDAEGVLAYEVRFE